MKIRCISITMMLLISLLIVIPTWSDDVHYKTSQGNVYLDIVQNKVVMGKKDRFQNNSSVKAKVNNSPRAGDSSIKQVGKSLFVINKQALNRRSLKTHSTQFDFVYPVYLRKSNGLNVYPRPEIIVKLKSDDVIDAVVKRHGLKVVRRVRYTDDQFLLQHNASLNPFDVSNALWDDPDVVWANPNVVNEIDIRFKPNDLYYPDQWHLNNTGQGGGKAGADISAETAWNLVQPDENVVIAIVDNGVDLSHPDLNIWSNPAEANGQIGVDDDQNGYVDDLHGWNFMEDNNLPDGVLDDHGTPCAGVAAAKGNNTIGVVGAAYGATILPMTVLGMFDGDATAETLAVAEGIRYAANYADVVSNSWGGALTDPDGDALTYATSNQARRGEKRVPVLFATGNDFPENPSLFYRKDMVLDAGSHRLIFEYEKDASGSSDGDFVNIYDAYLEIGSNNQKLFELPYSGDSNFESISLFTELDIPAGEHTIRFEYTKNESISTDKDGVIIEDVYINFSEDLSDYISLFDFSGHVNEEYTVGGDEPFFIEDDIFPYFVSGDIGDHETSWMEWTFEVPDNAEVVSLELFFLASTEENGDFFHIYIDGEELTGTFENPDFISTLKTIFDPYDGLSEDVQLEGNVLFEEFEVETDDVLALGINNLTDGEKSQLIYDFMVEENESNVSLVVQFVADTEEGKDFLKIILDGEDIHDSIEVGTTMIDLPFSGQMPENIAPIAGINLHPNIINIGASDDSDNRASYSQWGPELDFLAPSDGGQQGIITTVYQELEVDNDYGYTILSKGYTSNFGGTSSACPLAAGVFAMLISAYPEITVDQMLTILQETSDKIGDRTYDVNGYNQEYGYGRLNMEKAVQAALELKQTDVSAWSIY